MRVMNHPCLAGHWQIASLFLGREGPLERRHWTDETPLLSISENAGMTRELSTLRRDREILRMPFGILQVGG
jgi:hypothetical protein